MDPAEDITGCAGLTDQRISIPAARLLSLK
jgi:hypothetical protein